MDQPKYSSLMAVLSGVPDPRKARGQQLQWNLIWGVIASAMLSQQRGAAAIADAVRSYAASLPETFQLIGGPLAVWYGR